MYSTRGECENVECGAQETGRLPDNRIRGGGGGQLPESNVLAILGTCLKMLFYPRAGIAGTMSPGSCAKEGRRPTSNRRREECLVLRLAATS